MFFSNINMETKTLRTISLVVTFIGIVFILASNYVGNIAIRTTMILVFLISMLNFKMTYPFSSTLQKTYMMLSMIGSVAVFIMPQLTMFIVGIGLMAVSAPILYKAVKDKDYSDKVMIVISLVGFLFSIYCILSSSQALQTVIKMIGVALVILGCIIFFITFDIKRRTSEMSEHQEKQIDQFRFDNAEEIDPDRYI